MTKEFLKFTWQGRAEEVGPLLAALKDIANSSPWMGRGTRTCKVTEFHITGRRGGVSEGTIVVRFRPHGWTVRKADRTNDGQRLDGHGRPLPEGHEPVLLGWDVRGEIDFNTVSFGLLIEGPQE